MTTGAPTDVPLRPRSRETLERMIAAAEKSAREWREELAVLERQEMEQSMAAERAAREAERAAMCPGMVTILEKIESLEGQLRLDFMAKLLEILDVLRAIQTVCVPTVITTPSPTPNAPWQPGVPWWENGKIWCNARGTAETVPMFANIEATPLADSDGE